MGKRKLPPLSRAETEILTLLWDLRQATVQDVCDRLPESRQIAYATVQTMLRRLEKKGYVSHETQGKAHVFRPIADRNDVLEKSVSDFVDRLFGGDPIPLMLRLADHAQLSATDVERLKKLLGQDEA